jgi:tetratricopeptide (TPR) repeat protein
LPLTAPSDSFLPADVQKEQYYKSTESTTAHIRMRVAVASYELMYGSGTTNDAFDLEEAQTKAAALKDRKAIIEARLRAVERHVQAAGSLAAHIVGTPLAGIAQTLVNAIRTAKELFVAANHPSDDINVAKQHKDHISELVAGLRGLVSESENSLRKFADSGSIVAGSASAASSAGAGSITFVPSLLTQAADAFDKGNYVLARSLYSQVVSQAPHVSPAPVRTALGLCLYQLGHVEAARTAFARALQLQPDYPPALTFLATMENARLTSAAAASASGNAWEDEKKGGKDSAANSSSQQTMAAPVEAAASEIGSRAKVDQLLRKANAAASVAAVADAKDGPAASSAAVQAGGLHLPAHTLLELAHSTFERFAPLKLSSSSSSSSSSSAAASSSSEAVTATLTNGSRLIIFSADVRKALSNSQTLRFLIRKPGASGGPAKPLAVPLKLILDANPVVAMPLSSLPDQIAAAHPTTLKAKKDPDEASQEILFVGRARTPWPYASMEGVPVTAVDLEGSLQLAKMALQAAKTPELKAEAHYAMARAHHAKCIFMDASIEYKNCYKLVANYVPALFGLAQIALIGRQMDKVEEFLGKLLAAKPDDRSALRLLAYIRGLRAQSDNNAAFAEALETARKAYDASPADPVTAAMYGLLLARQDTPASIARAYKVFESIVERSDKAGVAVPSAVYNNCGVLAMRQASHEANLTQRRQLLALAERQLLKAVENVAAFELFPGDPEKRNSSEAKLQALFSPGGITIAFNLARLDETQGKPQAAEATYVKITQTAPSYFGGELSRRRQL